ncbi:MAG: IclR family transcriptional regulator [Pseudomonadota bacterium]
MSTVEKALEILSLFSETRPALGLTEVARILGRDKATVQRHLSALQTHGFLDQDPLTRSWHLGPALTRLAMVRERTWPVATSVKNIMTKLVEDTGETAHMSHVGQGGMHSVAIVETKIRGTRVFVDPTELLPIYASASGIAYLSALDDPSKQIAASMKTFTDTTPTNRQAVLEKVTKARARGWSLMRGTFEADVVGQGAPLFGPSGDPVGAISVAMPATRFDEVVAARNGPLVVAAAQAISRNYGAGHAVRSAAE